MKIRTNIKGQWILWLLLVSFVLNHMVDIDHFPFSPSYHFPLQNIIDSLVRGVAILLLAEVNFHWYQSKNLQEEWGRLFSKFILTSLATVSIVYILTLTTMTVGFGEERTAYNITKDYGVTILVSALIIAVFYLKLFYQNFGNAHALRLEHATNQADNDLVIPRIKDLISDYNSIAYFFSKDKVVFRVNQDGTSFPTDHVLSQLQREAEQNHFFRANRQYLLHDRAIRQYEKIENGKLAVDLLEPDGRNELVRIIISRYKRKAFIEWYNNPL